MGDAYKAQDTTLGRTVAVKVLPDVVRSEERMRRFVQEIAWCSLGHQPDSGQFLS